MKKKKETQSINYLKSESLNEVHFFPILFNIAMTDFATLLYKKQSMYEHRITIKMDQSNLSKTNSTQLYSIQHTSMQNWCKTNIPFAYFRFLNKLIRFLTFIIRVITLTVGKKVPAPCKIVGGDKDYNTFSLLFIDICTVAD